MDFDPTEDIVFPSPVEMHQTSQELWGSIQDFRVPVGHTALWFLGNNTFLAKSHQGTILAVDPYLTDFCASKRVGQRVAKSRLLPVFLEPAHLCADLILLTHSHCDHTDPFTLEQIPNPVETLFAGPYQCVQKLREIGIPDAAIALVHPAQRWTFRDVTITGIFAEPTDDTDLNHMGFSLQFEHGPLWYVSGDTAASARVGGGLMQSPDVMCVCINGGYHNLSHWEAAELCAKIQPKVAVPCHFDMMPHNVQPPHMFRKSLWEKTKGSVAYTRMDYAQPWIFSQESALSKAVTF